jgi:hypothetical protein
LGGIRRYIARGYGLLGLYSSQYAGVLENDLPHPHNAGVDRAGECDHYILEPSPLLSEFAGRLYVEWGEGKLSWIQRPALQNKAVLELRRDLVDPPFPGYIDFIEPLSRLEALPQAWRDALRIAKGVYLLTCARTKEQYVGKADGGDGFLGRWSDYIANGHGGNVGLLRREPSDYQVSILETAGSAATANDILKMEDRWKNKLRSKEMGLNH